MARHVHTWTRRAFVSTAGALGVATAVSTAGIGMGPTSAAAAATGGAPTRTRPATMATTGTAGAAARRFLGTSPSKEPWFSGAWVGGYMSATRATRWGTWRGSPSDVTPTYPEWGTWSQLSHSQWHIDTYKGFRGRLLYGLPLLPRNGTPAQLTDVARGKHDAVFRGIAKDLRTRGRGNSVVRIGWEANGTWMPFRASARTAKNYRNAYRHVAQVMAKTSPGLVFAFDINCGTKMPGQTNRLDSLNRLYPGNDVVDLVGCSTYDWDVVGANSEASWRRSLHPAQAVGVGDIATFARAHRKGMSISEWGLAAKGRDGHGDNPFYITKMRQFFQANSDVLALESYFNAGDTGQRSSLWPEAPQNPRSAVVYRKLW